MVTTLFDGNGNQVTVANDAVQLFDTPIITGVLPTVYVECETALADLNHDVKSYGTVDFVDGKKKFKLPVSIKAQGDNSLSRNPKQMNITFYTDDTYDKKQKLIFNGWYPCSKFHVKSNPQDTAKCKNSVGAKLLKKWLYNNLPNGAFGVVDSFPVIIYYNGEWIGCYTWNLTQDEDLFNFDGDDETAGKSLAYRCDAGNTIESYGNSAKWEYRGGEDETDEMRNVFNTTALAVLQKDTTTLTKEDVEGAFDLDFLLGYMATVEYATGSDSLATNMGMATWDGGATWYWILYDLDWWFPENNNRVNNEIFAGLPFFAAVYSLYETEFKAMYANLRKNGMDVDSIVAAVDEFQSHWGWLNLQKDNAKWGNGSGSNLATLKNALTSRQTVLDERYGYTAT